MTIPYSRGRNIHDASPRRREAADWCAFVAAIDRDRAPRKDGAAYLCGTFKDGKRHAASAEPRCWVALDFDRIDPEALAALRLHLARWSGVAWSTHSSTREAPRERVLLELDRPLPREELITVCEGVARDLGEEFGDAIELDPSTFKPEQPLFLPPVGVVLARFDGAPIETARYLQKRAADSEQAAPRPQGRVWRDGARTAGFMTLIGRLHRQGLPAAAIEAAALATNATQCEPPLPDDKVRAMVASVVARYARGEPVQPPPTVEPPDVILPRRLDLVQLAASDPQPPAFILRDWLPEGECTLLGGHGGTGKSALAKQLAVALAAGVPFFGLGVRRARVLFVSLEDPQSVLHWRLHRIARASGLDLAALRAYLTMIDASDTDGTLMIETRDGVGLTVLYDWLREAMADHQVLILDGASDAFGGNENNRAQVRQFLRAVRRLIPRDGAALVLGHTDKLAAKGEVTSQGYSGSTAWSNSVRARWFLRKDEDEGDLLLELQKSNHGPAGAQIRLRFDEQQHVFIGEAATPAGGIARAMLEADERELLLRLIREAAAEGDAAPAATSGRRTTYAALFARQGFPRSLQSNAGRARFWRLLEQLRAGGAVKVTTVRTSCRHQREVLTCP